MRSHCVVLREKQREWHREPVQMRQWIWEEIKSHATGEHLKRSAERLGLAVPLKELEFKGSVQTGAYSGANLSWHSSLDPPPCNKLQRAFYLLSFVWPARESWSSAVPFVLQCLCRYTCSKGRFWKFSRQWTAPCNHPISTKMSKDSWAERLLLQADVSPAPWIRWSYCLHRKIMIALTKCELREEMENNHLSPIIYDISSIFFPIILLNHFKCALVSLPLALHFLSPNHLSGI